MNLPSAISPQLPAFRAVQLAGNRTTADPAGPIPASEFQALAAAGKSPGLAASQPAGAAFYNLLGQMVEEVNAKQAAAGQAVQDLQSGQSISLHRAMIAIEEASVSFQLMVEVRNKLLESYQELMRMQI